jgi:hypothetical protein
MGAAVMWGASADPILDEPVRDRPQHFTQADYQAFDRDFSLDGEPCMVGVKRKGVCFGASPFEASLASGSTIPLTSPDMPAEFPVILQTELKAAGLETWRFGRSLVLVKAGTRDIVDVMDLNAPYQEQGSAMLASREDVVSMR